MSDKVERVWTADEIIRELCCGCSGESCHEQGPELAAYLAKCTRRVRELEALPACTYCDLPARNRSENEPVCDAHLPTWSK